MMKLCVQKFMQEQSQDRMAIRTEELGEATIKHLKLNQRKKLSIKHGQENIGSGTTADVKKKVKNIQNSKF